MLLFYFVVVALKTDGWCHLCLHWLYIRLVLERYKLPFQIIRQMFPHLTTRRLGIRGQSGYHYYGLAVKHQSIYYRPRYASRAVNGHNKRLTTAASETNNSRSSTFFSSGSRPARSTSYDNSDAPSTNRCVCASIMAFSCHLTNMNIFTNVFA